MDRFLLYGATGYVGREIAVSALRRGLRPVLGGRSGAVRDLAERLGTDAVVVDVDDRRGLSAALADVPVVLNCAGPFHRTYRQLFDACLATRTHYLDITGEPVVYEAAIAAHPSALGAGVLLLPGVGFDVVPTDCLAAHLVRRLPTATHLRLAFQQRGPAALPPGTIRTMLETASLRSGALHRVDGELVEARPRPTLEVDFGSGPVTTVLRTWGDVYLAERSTGLRNVDDFVAVPPRLRRRQSVLERFAWLLRAAPVREFVLGLVPTGATSRERAATVTHVWGEVRDPDGARAVSRIHGPEAGVEWTTRCALDVLGRVLHGDAPAGHQTPSSAYGPDLVLEAEGVTREDLPVA